MDNQEQIKQAEEALKNGDRLEARRILEEAVLKEPDNAGVWKMLFLVIDDPFEKCDCLKNVVRIHPKDRQAVQKLHKYKASAEYREARAAIYLKNKKQEGEKRKNRHLRADIDKVLDVIKQNIGW